MVNYIPRKLLNTFHFKLQDFECTVNSLSFFYHLSTLFDIVMPVQLKDNRY